MMFRASPTEIPCAERPRSALDLDRAEQAAARGKEKARRSGPSPLAATFRSSW